MSVVSDTIDWLGDSVNYSGSGGVPTRMVEHLVYTAETIAIAGLIAIPIGLWIGHARQRSSSHWIHRHELPVALVRSARVGNDQ